ncbi:YdcF family protein [Lentibacillus sp. N15]|uniref:YdcF family protein n=1 Tax=Lentibacillus songyuanensis TaxID=3136161 RepID=UPI0031BBBE48
MKPMIPKEPVLPSLNDYEIDCLTTLVFGKEIELKKCDTLFVFSGTHPGHWEKSIEAYKKGLVDTIIVTGGRSQTGNSHPDWKYKDVTEADVIISYLLAAGIPENIITYEKKSTNTLENVLYAKEVYDFNQVTNLLFVCKSHVTGRQYRTLAKHLPSGIHFIPYTFNAAYNGHTITRTNWMETETGRKRIWGEYLRIDHYGKKGDIQKI